MAIVWGVPNFRIFTFRLGLIKFHRTHRIPDVLKIVLKWGLLGFLQSDLDLFVLHFFEIQFLTFYTIQMVFVEVNANLMTCRWFDGNTKYFEIWRLYRRPLNFASLKLRYPYIFFVLVWTLRVKTKTMKHFVSCIMFFWKSYNISLLRAHFYPTCVLLCRNSQNRHFLTIQYFSFISEMKHMLTYSITYRNVVKHIFIYICRNNGKILDSAKVMVGQKLHCALMGEAVKSEVSLDIKIYSRNLVIAALYRTPDKKE